ncbi:LCP family protein [Abyssisolibacter fermentans]|uniref:LCP family protein n=1 Tax=Abyssisolibacter fermentans TaxID=1766203 RepID=UPI000831077E|nr:LCP family protein [Abyssisolibacter fermentans]
MKYFIKIFAIAFLCFALAVGAGVMAYMKIYDPQDDLDSNNPKNPIDVGDNVNNNNEEKDPFKIAINNSKRVNVLLLGLESTRTDTIIFASFDPKTKKVDMLSIPRDTYYWDKGYNKPDQKKINAKYGRSNAKGTMNAVSTLLGGVPIHYYVSITYKGVEDIVDSLGGVEVNVPFHMVYHDTTVGKSLHIDIPKGLQTLDGKNAVKFLRYRKGYRDGDLGRVRAQQQFIKSAINKALGFRLPIVIKKSFSCVKTDMPLTDMLMYAKDVYGINPSEDISMSVLSGKARMKDGLSYFFHDPKMTREYVMKLYDVKEENKVANDKK